MRGGFLDVFLKSQKLIFLIHLIQKLISLFISFIEQIKNDGNN